MRKPKLSPCPICGMPPVIDEGLIDAKFDRPIVECPAVLTAPSGEMFSCATNADGIEAWETKCDLAKMTSEKTG